MMRAPLGVRSGAWGLAGVPGFVVPLDGFRYAE